MASANKLRFWHDESRSAQYYNIYFGGRWQLDPVRPFDIYDDEMEGMMQYMADVARRAHSIVCCNCDQPAVCYCYSDPCAELCERCCD
jgi:hypothetical protein